MITETMYAGQWIAGWKSLIVVFCQGFFFSVRQVKPYFGKAYSSTGAHSGTYIPVGPPCWIQVESGELCFCLNGFYHWPLLNFATDCTEFPANVVTEHKVRIYDIDSRAAILIFGSKWTTPESTLDHVRSPRFAFCMIYTLSRTSVLKESAIKFFPAYKKKKSRRLISAGYCLNVCPVFTVRASVPVGASK